MNKIKILILLALLTSSIFAMDLKQTTEIPDSLYIGIPFYIRLEIPAGVDSLHVVVPDSLPNFQILEQKRSTVKDSREFIIKAAAFEIGDLRFPQLGIDVYKRASRDSACISPFNLKVRSVLPEKGEPKLKDIAPPLDVPWTIWNYMILALIIALIIGISYLIRRYLKKKKGLHLSFAPSTDLRPIWKIALDDLEALQAQRLLEQGDFLNYHFGLSMILRWFLENYAGFNAVEMTSSEIRDLLEKRDFPRRVGIIEFLQGADTVKFAKHIPSRDESESAYKWLYMYLKSFGENNQEQGNGNA